MILSRSAFSAFFNPVSPAAPFVASASPTADIFVLSAVSRPFAASAPSAVARSVTAVMNAAARIIIDFVRIRAMVENSLNEGG